MQMEIDAANREHGVEENFADVTGDQQVPKLTGENAAEQVCLTSRYDTDANPHETGAKKRLLPVFTREDQQKPEELESSSSDMDSWCLDESSEDDINATTSSEEFSLLASSSEEEK